MRFVPVHFSLADGTMSQPNGRNAFELPPSSTSITLAEVFESSNSTAGRDDFDLTDFTDDLEVRDH